MKLRRSRSAGQVFSILMLFLAGGPVGAASEDAPQMAFLGSSLWTKAHDVEIRDGLAYCAFLNGLQILDLSNPKDPEILSALHLGGGYAVALAGNIALVAAADKGLAVIDVSDPKAPVLKRLLDTPGEARDVAVHGSLALVADGTAGLLAVDLADPAAPRVAASWDSPGEASGIALRGQTVFLADGSAGLQIVAVAAPAKLSPAGAIDTDGTAESVALSGNIAYIADGSGGIKVVDVSSTARPKLVASLTASGYARSVAASGTLLGAGSLYDGGYQLFDISRPDAPVLVSTNKYTMYNEGWRVVLNGSRGVVIDYFSGLFFLDFADPKKPAPAGYLPTPSTVVGVCARDRYAFAVGELSGVLAVDVLDPARPILVGATNIFRGVQNITVNGNYVYVTDRWSIRVFDVTDPAKPRPGKPLTFAEGIPRTLVVRGSSAYLTADNFGFYTLDLTDPAVPKIAGSFRLPGFTYGLAVSGDSAYLANSDTGLHILDIRKREAPAEIGAIKLAGEPSGVAVRGRYAYVASGPDGLIVVDVGRPDAPRVLGAAASGDYSSAVVLDGDFAYVADGLAGVMKIDVTDPGSPRLVSSYDTPGEAQNLCVLGKTILVADTYSLICSVGPGSADIDDGDLVDTAAGQVEAAVGRRDEVADDPAARRDGPALERPRLRIEGHDRIGLHARLAVPDRAVGEDVYAVGPRAGPAGRRPLLDLSSLRIEPAEEAAGEIGVVQEAVPGRRDPPRPGPLGQKTVGDVEGFRIDPPDLVGPELAEVGGAVRPDDQAVRPGGRRGDRPELDLAGLGVEPADEVPALYGEKDFAAPAEDKAVRIAGPRVGHRILGDLARARIEPPDIGLGVGREPDVAVPIDGQSVRPRSGRLHREFLDGPGRRIEPAEDVRRLPRVPEGPIRRDGGVVRARPGRRHVVFADGDLALGSAAPAESRHRHRPQDKGQDHSLIVLAHIPLPSPETRPPPIYAFGGRPQIRGRPCSLDFGRGT
jgi:hypothetical protein